MTTSNRVGIYAWAGPGTIRLIQTKYHSPQIDQDSFLSAYDLSYLSTLKSLFNVSDAWVTYSWGFSDAVESEDYQFLRDRLENFDKLHIRTHAYVQGLNVVTSEFPDSDFFCKDAWGRKITYSKGRSFICPNHPDTIRLLLERVERASQENVAGIFIDNILFGLPPFTVSTNLLPFFGCSCGFCQEKFESAFGYPLPLNQKHGNEISDYLQFRADSITTLIERLSRSAHQKHLEFGINLYDPSLRLDTLFYGYKLRAISQYLNYLLIENHSLPNQGSKTNEHLLALLKNTKKPVFVVSYKEGIGYEKQFTQQDVNAIFSESQSLGYFPCLKVTEFTTGKKWHMLDPSLLKPPASVPLPLKKEHHRKINSPASRLQRFAVDRLSKTIISLMNASQEHAILSSVATHSGIHMKQVRSARITHL